MISDTLVLIALLAASLAAACSGLMVHAQIPCEIIPRKPKPDDDSTWHRHIANGLLGLSAVMLAASAAFWLDHRGTNLHGMTGTSLSKVWVVVAALVAGFVQYWHRRERSRKRDGC